MAGRRNRRLRSWGGGKTARMRRNVGRAVGRAGLACCGGALLPAESPESAAAMPAGTRSTLLKADQKEEARL